MTVDYSGQSHLLIPLLKRLNELQQTSMESSLRIPYALPMQLPKHVRPLPASLRFVRERIGRTSGELGFPCFLRRSDGEGEEEGAALALFRFKPDAAPVSLDQFAAEEETQPGAGDAMRGSIAGA